MTTPTIQLMPCDPDALVTIREHDARQYDVFMRDLATQAQMYHDYGIGKPVSAAQLEAAAERFEAMCGGRR